jgi:hypothetical protein
MEDSMNWKVRFSHDVSRIVCLVLLTALFPGTAAAEKTPFTIEDSLNVKNFRSMDMTDDGKYVAGVIADRRGRLGTDHSEIRPTCRPAR